MPAIEVPNLTKKWNQTKAIDRISFQVETGEIFGFLGPNGVGKTSTIKMLMGLTMPTSSTKIGLDYDR